MTPTDLTQEQRAAIARGKAVALKQLARARVTSQFETLYDVGGVEECLLLIAVCTERLLERVRVDAARAADLANDAGLAR